MPRSLYPDLLRKAPVFEPAYRAWLGAGRHRPALWRTFAGLLLVGAMWFAATLLVLVIPTAIEIVLGGGSFLQLSDIEKFSTAMDTLPPAVISILVLMSFAGIWLGVWLAVRLLHRRSMASVMSAKGRWSTRQFWAGFGVAAGFSAVMAGLALLSGGEGMLGTADPMAWGIYIIPLAIAVFVQSCGEEVLFRGYLQQQLAARCRAPWLWLILPSVLFGLLHGGEGWQGIAYIAITAIIGIVAGVMVWRTGSLAAAMGLHFGNNFSVFALIGPEALPRMLEDPEWARDNLNIETFLIDGAFFLAICLIILSARSPLVALSRSRRAA